MPAQLPNLITLLRLCSVPVVLWAIVADRPQLAFWLFVAAGLSDAVDGAIARRFGLRSDLGAWLDPAADKALLVGVYLALAWSGDLPAWLAAVVVGRDVLIVAGAALTFALTRVWGRPQPLLVSKINTAAQIALAAVVLAKGALGVEWPPVVDAGALAVGATTLLSGGAYMVTWLRETAARRDRR